jgi:hypothetical protein
MTEWTGHDGRRLNDICDDPATHALERGCDCGSRPDTATGLGGLENLKVMELNHRRATTS